MKARFPSPGFGLFCKEKMSKILNHIANFRYLYIWPGLAVLWLYGSGRVAAWLNHGRALLDDPSAIYGYAFIVVPVINALFITSLYSAFLNNSLTREEYVKAPWQSQLADNAPELVVFIVTLWFFRAHS